MKLHHHVKSSLQRCFKQSFTALRLQVPFARHTAPMDLSEICDNAKKGREYALLGNYDTSSVYYQGVLQQIHKHCQTLRDPALKVKWQQVSAP